jgi:hypothetical protein
MIRHRRIICNDTYFVDINEIHDDDDNRYHDMQNTLLLIMITTTTLTSLFNVL